jgi:hypothetical protein
MTAIANNPSETVTVLADAKNSYVTVIDKTVSVGVVAGVQGVAGRDGLNGAGVIQVAFGWGDATPALLVNAPANKAVLSIEVAILRAFDVASSIVIGDTANPNRLFNLDGLDLTQVGSYQVTPDYIYSSATDIFYTITAGSGNSTGGGLISISLQA